MGEDLDAMRLMIDSHIFEHRAAEMGALEVQIRLMQEDLRRAYHQYLALARVSGEDDLARQAQEETWALEGKVTPALAISRKNLDEQARQAMLALDPSFASIHRLLQQLIDVNQAASRQAMVRIGRLQGSTIVGITGAGSLGILLTLLIGAWSVREVDRGEREQEGYARALEEVNRELDAFAGRVAHDLRGPMSTVSLAGSRLSKLAQDSSTAELHDRGIKRMRQLIDDLLALSRARTVQKEASDPMAVAALVREELAGRLEQEGGELTLAVDPATVWCGPGLLHQVLFNLTENALKYRKRDVPPRVMISGHTRAERYHLEVADNGIGMSPEDARRVFQPFFRAGAVGDRPGTGLGLSIVKRIVDAVGGSITVESELGRGSNFKVELVLAVTARS
jgi:signal transduction histidine kinase